MNTKEYYEKLFKEIDEEFSTLDSICIKELNECIQEYISTDINPLQIVEKYSSTLPCIKEDNYKGCYIELSTKKIYLYRVNGSNKDEYCSLYDIKFVHKPIDFYMYLVGSLSACVEIENKVLNFDTFDLEEYIFNHQVKGTCPSEIYMYLSNHYFKYVLSKIGIDCIEAEMIYVADGADI